MIYCTCGHLLVESEPSQNFNQWRLDALSIPNYVIKKRRPHSARHEKTEARKEYHIAFNAWKRCRKRIDGQEEHYKGIHDRFLRDQVYRESQLKIGWTSASRWTSWHRRITRTVYPKRNLRDIKESGISH